MCSAACLTAAAFLGATNRLPFFGAAAAFCACRVAALELLPFERPFVCPWTIVGLCVRQCVGVVRGESGGRDGEREVVVLVQSKNVDRMWKHRRSTELSGRP